MGEKCFYSHEGYKAADAMKPAGDSAYRGGRGGMRGGRPISSTASFGGSDHSARIRSGASRGGRGGFIGH
jgi:hypothetical protein